MASKRHIRRKACKGKVRYTSSKAAMAAAFQARNRTHGDWIISYGCRFCGGFHIGHPPAKVRKAIRSRVNPLSRSEG